MIHEAGVRSIQVERVTVYVDGHGTDFTKQTRGGCEVPQTAAAGGAGVLEIAGRRVGEHSTSVHHCATGRVEAQSG